MRTRGPPALDLPIVKRKIVDFIRTESGGRGLVLGLSGGVDSAVIATLSVKAVGKGRVLALIMPEIESSPPGDTQDALCYSDSLGIRHELINFTHLHQCFLKYIPRSGDRVAEGNVKARLRMALLYYFANHEERIVVGSGDRSELAIGYFTKYGDGGVDILPIGGLYKIQVRSLAKHIGVPDRILKKKSSPCLWAGQLAEDELGLEYGEVDLILNLHLDEGYSRGKLVEELGKRWEGKIDRVLGRVAANSHKRRMPLIADINAP
jgi:NAD+ synthase